MLDRGIGLPGPQPKPATVLPTPSETLVNLQRAIGERHSGVDVFPKVPERVGGCGEHFWVVASGPQSPPSKIDASAAARLRELGPTVNMQVVMAPRRQGKSPAVLWVALDRLPQQFKR